MAIGILVGVLVVIGSGLYILMPKTPKPPENIKWCQTIGRLFRTGSRSRTPPGSLRRSGQGWQVVYANGFGIADGPRNVSATKDTVYHWWSMTKIPTAVAVMQLHERGLLDIDDPIRNYLPYFKVTYKGAEQTNISIRQVLNHTAGLSNAMPELVTWLHSEGEPQ